MSEKLKVLVVGCGNMGASHARAYDKLDDFEIAGVVSRGPGSRGRLAEELGDLPQYDDFDRALDATHPDAVSINTYTDTHAPYAIRSMEDDAERVVETAVKNGRKLVVGYILRHHPSWMKFVEIAQSLGKPLVMRMNLNQQSSGEQWQGHKNLMDNQSPIVDCGVHYVDMMCLMTRAKPIRVSAIGARLTDELVDEMYNYGQLQVTFDDGSCGWYEAGWGPMMSQEAFFVKDVVGPAGCVSIVAEKTGETGESADIDSHTSTDALRVHHGALGADGAFEREDEILSMSDEPDHQGLCDREQAYFLEAIRDDMDLTDHMRDAVASLRIVLAADESFRTGKTVEL
jgi:predicted dehydrogenase